MTLSSSRGILLSSSYMVNINIHLKSGVKHEIEVPFELTLKKSSMDVEGIDNRRLDKFQESLMEKFSFF